MYRKFVGKVSWLAENYRPDLAIVVLNMARKSKKGTLRDLANINKVIKKIKMKKYEVIFTRIGRKEDLGISGIGDASYKLNKKAIGGNMVLLQI